jgi:hypothetical protein
MMCQAVPVEFSEFWENMAIARVHKRPRCWAALGSVSNGDVDAMRISRVVGLLFFVLAMREAG